MENRGQFANRCMYGIAMIAGRDLVHFLAVWGKGIRNGDMYGVVRGRDPRRTELLLPFINALTVFVSCGEGCALVQEL